MLAALGLVGAAGLLQLADRLWAATVLAFVPRWPWGLGLLAIVAASVVASRWFWVAFAACGALFPFAVLDLRVSLLRGAPSLRVATYNVGGGVPEDPAALLAFAGRLGADVVGLVECKVELPPAPGWFIHQANGACLLSRHRIAAVDVRPPRDLWEKGGSGVINRYELETPGGRLNVLLVHLETVREGLEALRWKRLAGVSDLRANIELRDLESRLAREWSRRGQGDLLVLGDFNLPVESAIYRRHWGDLGNGFSSCGNGFGSTKATRWHGVRIDHVLYGRAWRCTGARVVDHLGGDHRPLVVELARSG